MFILRYVVEDEARPLRLPGEGTNRPSTEDRSPTLGQASGLVPGP
jgi:hypothetical protein